MYKRQEKDTAYQEVGNYFYPTQTVEKNIGRSFLRGQVNEQGAVSYTHLDVYKRQVIGHDRNFQLRAGNMTSPDIRAGIALLIAAMSADGTSRIYNIEQIDRGYQNIDQRLNALGARITRI